MTIGGLSCATIKSVFYPASPKHLTRKNINPEIVRVMSAITPHNQEIFWDKSLQFTKNVLIRVNAGNRLLLNMIWIRIFVGFMDIAQSFAKFALNHLTMDKHLPPIKSSSSLPIAKIYQHSRYGRVFVNKRRFHLHVAKVQYSQRQIANWCT